MAVLNDFGQGAYDKVVNDATTIAKNLGIDPKVIFGYINDTGHYPMSIEELESWGNGDWHNPDTNPWNFNRRDRTTGAWTPVSGARSPGWTDDNAANGFPGHRNPIDIDNAVQHFLQTVNGDGSMPGGSVNPQWNRDNADWMKQFNNALDMSVAGLGRSLNARNASKAPAAQAQAQPAPAGPSMTAQSFPQGIPTPTGGYANGWMPNAFQPDPNWWASTSLAPPSFSPSAGATPVPNEPKQTGKPVAVKSADKQKGVPAKVKAPTLATPAASGNPLQDAMKGGTPPNAAGIGGPMTEITGGPGASKANTPDDFANALANKGDGAGADAASNPINPNAPTLPTLDDGANNDFMKQLYQMLHALYGQKQ
jgi:hypothetical protein